MIHLVMGSSATWNVLPQSQYE